LAEAAATGNASLYASGIEPGFAADHLVLMMATQCKTISRIHASEIALYDDYPVAETMMDAMGFAMPLDYVPMLAYAGTIAFQWGPGLRLIAKGLGWEIDEIRENFDRVATDRDLDVAFGTAKAGTCGALRTQAIAVVDGREVIVIEHVNRLAADLGREWGVGGPNPVYRITIDGEPDVECEMTANLRDPEASGSAMTSGGGRDVVHGHARRQRNTVRRRREGRPALGPRPPLDAAPPRLALSRRRSPPRGCWEIGPPPENTI
jgi:2,4-diaminopentanoate dehydrogenase